MGGAPKTVYLQGLGIIGWDPVRQPLPCPREPVRALGDQPPSLLCSRHSALGSQEALSLLAQDRQRMKLPTQGPAELVKNCFLPLREYFKYFSTGLTSSL